MKNAQGAFGSFFLILCKRYKRGCTTTGFRGRAVRLVAFCGWTCVDIPFYTFYIIYPPPYSYYVSILVSFFIICIK